jgi:dynein heavy chain
VHPYEYHPIGWKPGETDFSTVFVEYSDTVKNSRILQLLVEHEQACVLVGLAGTGKTVLMEQYLELADPETLQTSTIDVNFYLEHRDVQHAIESVIDKRSGRIFGPPTGKKMLFFLDDLNLPEIEEFGTQNAHSMLRMIMDLRTFYDREDLSFRKEITDCLYVAAMNPSAGSFSIADRVQRHFAVLACDIPSEAEAKGVYYQIFEGHLKGCDFASNITAHGTKLIDATIQLHAQIAQKFLPGAIKFMYIWNFRELSNIVRGLCRAASSTIVDMTTMVRLWGHECNRVFSDRMVSMEECDKYFKILQDVSAKTFGEICNVEEALNAENMIFTSFYGSKDNEYNLVNDFQGLQESVDAKLSEYNESNSVMDLVLFKEAIEHICRICRVIEYPGGNAMLIGVGGSGKQSLSRLAGSIMGCRCEQLKVSSKYGIEDLKEDLKKIYMDAGVAGKSILFIMTDSQVVKDHFLVFLNNMLASGRIPGLFEKDEIDNIIGSLRNPAKQAGIPDTPAHMLDFFYSRIKQFLHISLCFSPVGDWFRVRARRFPGLINFTVLDQFHPWPRAALESVAARFIAILEIPEETKQNIAVHMGVVHLSVSALSVKFQQSLRRYNYVTPKSFLELIAFYKLLLNTKTSNLNKQIYRLDVGLSKLKKTSEDVAELRVDLDHTMVKVEEKKQSTNALLISIGEQRAEAEVIEARANGEALLAGQASEEAAVIEAEADVELKKAKPAMDAANEAVNCLDKASLGELRGFAKPPNGVDVCMAGVLMMMDGEFKNHSWDRAKKMMSNLGQFLEDLKTFPAEQMSDELMDKLEKIVENPVMDYDVMKKKSIAAANLSSWVCNVYTYKRIYDKVKPLMDALEEAQGKKAAAQGSLEAAQEEVAEIKTKLRELGELLKIATAEKLVVEDEAAKCLVKLNLAERLVSGLSSEGERWTFEIGEMKKGGDTLVGDSLLAGAYVSYIGAFNAEYRQTLWAETWLKDLQEKGIPLSEGVDPLSVLSDDGNNAQMMSEGLPADRMSIENGAMITQTSRWPLLIDPQLQGIVWLRKRENMAADRKALAMREEAIAAGEDPNLIVVSSNLITLQLSNNNWLKRLSSGIANGNTVIIENCPVDLDATLDPVLQRAIYKKGRNNFLQLAGEELEYDKNFKLFLQTKLSNPHYKPEIFASCTVINFIATESGLEDQLLAKVVNVEKPELEAEKQLLIKQFNEYKIKLLELENNLLEKLSNAPEDILSDIPLVESLEATKLAATEIQAAVIKGKKTEILINQAREVYRPVASEASMMYFICTEMCNIDHMYQYSLGAFTYFFFKSIAKTPPEEDIAKRVVALTDSMRFTIFTWVCRGLATEHKIVYMTQIAVKLMQRGSLEEKFDHESFNFLMRGQKSLGADNSVPWLPTINWLMVNSLAKIEGFEKFPSDLVEAAPRFLEWYNHETPETEKLPLDWSGLEKEPFKKLLVLRALRADRLVIAITRWLRGALPHGNEYVDADSTNSSLRILELAIEDSMPEVPIFFILSAGTDVVADVDKLAVQSGFEKGISYWNVGMGQGQDIVAMDRLQLGHTQGHWVILNNCHLMPQWCIELEKKLDTFNVEGSHESFRVFLTAEPSADIPIGILSRCIKLTSEPPAGLRANLKRAFCSFDEDDFDELDNKQKAITFAMSFYHAILMERKKFGSKGFNMLYPFSLGDLRDSSIVLANYMENASSSKIPWEDLRYLFGEITYGGHIVNDLDRLLNITYLNFYLQDDVLDQKEMLPFVEDEKGVSFKTPIPTTWELYNKHIDEYMRTESPLAFGLHPNAEIDFRLSNSNDVLARLTELQPRDAGAAEGQLTPTEIAEQAMSDIKDKINDFWFDMFELNSSLEGDLRGPYQNVFLQECTIMNLLTGEMRRSLKELKMGFDGELIMSPVMESLMLSLYLDRVAQPWAKLAWSSERPLAAWILDLLKRYAQLAEWTAVPADIPQVIWLSGLSNPPSFLTAIKQVTAQKAKLPLDSIVIQTDVQKKMERKDLDGPAKDGGCYCNGFYLEGARWDLEACVIVKSLPKEMFVRMPIINCRGILSSARETAGIFQCPLYKTQFRGPTFVFMAQLKTKASASRWILAGVALVLDVGE